MDFNGVETYIDKMGKDNDICWFPHYKAMVIVENDYIDDTREDV